MKYRLPGMLGSVDEDACSLPMVLAHHPTGVQTPLQKWLGIESAMLALRVAYFVPAVSGTSFSALYLLCIAGIFAQFRCRYLVPSLYGI